MKKLLAITAAVAVVTMAGSAFAASATTTVAVSASITGACTVASAGSIAYGALDPLTGGAVSAVVTQPVVKCTTGLSVAIADDLGLHEGGGTQAKMSDGGTGSINYAFGHAANATGLGSASSLPIALTGTALATADYASAPAGSYADTITLTLTF
jgi:spore coat protein U-like protein